MQLKESILANFPPIPLRVFPIGHYRTFTVWTGTLILSYPTTQSSETRKGNPFKDGPGRSETHTVGDYIPTVKATLSSSRKHVPQHSSLLTGNKVKEDALLNVVEEPLILQLKQRCHFEISRQ